MNRRGIVQNVPEEVGDRLASPTRVALAAAVTQADVQHSIRAEQDLAAVVVGERLLHGEKHRLAGGVRQVRIPGRDPEHRDHRVPADVCIVNHEPAIRGVRRVEREAEEPLFAAGRDPVGQVQERRRQQRPILHDPEAAPFLHDEQPGVAGRRRQIQRKAQARRHRVQTDLDGTFGRTDRRPVAGIAGGCGTHQQTES